MPIPLTPALVATHERLTPRVTALLKQIERAAARQPGAPVPAATASVARGLLREAKKLLGREVGAIAANTFADLSGLSVGLGQLAAGLEAFEAAHSSYSASAKCVVWRVAGPVLPVTRLKPPGVEAGPAISDPESDAAREALLKMIIARFCAGYDEGYSDASEGRPPSSRYAQLVWDRLVTPSGNDEVTRLRELERRFGKFPPPHLLPLGAKPDGWEEPDTETEDTGKPKGRAGD